MEAIINAFCHRNYNEYDSVNIAIFKDRLEIRSPGSLYGGLTIKKIKKQMVSKRRNELIANMFHLVHFVEKWGRGIKLILSKEPTTNFKIVADIFIAVFLRKEIGSTTQKTTPLATPQVTPPVRLTELEEKIIKKIGINQKISRNGLAKELGITLSTVKEYLDKLKTKGILKRAGKTSAGHWKIMK